MMSWEDLLRLCYVEAAHSPDPSTQNGAVLVQPAPIGGEPAWSTIHHNRFPTGIQETTERLEPPVKYDWIEHAERNAIYCAAENGIACRGLVMVCPWAPCCACARAIISSGIIGLVTHKQARERTPIRWYEDIVRAESMLIEAKVWIKPIDVRLGTTSVLFDGQVWEP